MLSKRLHTILERTAYERLKSNECEEGRIIQLLLRSALNINVELIAAQRPTINQDDLMVAVLLDLERLHGLALPPLAVSETEASLLVEAHEDMFETFPQTFLLLALPD